MKLQYTQRLKDFHKNPCPICTPGYHVELRKRGKLLHTKGKISGKFLPQTSPRFYTIRILRGCQLWQCTSQQWWSQTVECGHTSQTASYYDWGNLCHMVATNNACSNTGRYKFSKYELQNPTYFENNPKGADNFESCRTNPIIKLFSYFSQARKKSCRIERYIISHILTARKSAGGRYRLSGR